MAGYVIRNGKNEKKQDLDDAFKAILDIETKKKAFHKGSLNEQNVIMQKINEVYNQIGERLYGFYEKDEMDIEKLTPLLETVKSHFQTLEANKLKLEEILERYDEELKILKSTQPNDIEICPKCGTIYNINEAAFCGGCGNKLTQPDSIDAKTASSSLCNKCGEELTPDSIFCAACGNKVT